MIRACTVLFLSCFLTAAAAHGDAPGFPNMYDVTGVTTDDVLNVRAKPQPGSDILATLAPDRSGVEGLGLSETGAWVQVSFGEITGWVDARFLAAQAPRPMDLLPVPMRCYGTEPFWGLNFPNGNLAEFERLPDPEFMLRVDFQSTAVGRQSGDVVARLIGTGDQGRTNRGTLTLRHEMCSDGMSGRSFALSALFLLETSDKTALYSGCCSLTTP